MIGILAVALFTGLWVVLAERLLAAGWPAKRTRKIVHIGGGIGAACLPLVTTASVAILFGLAMTVVMLASTNWRWFRSIHGQRAFDFGAVGFPIGLVVGAWLWWGMNPLLFQAAALIEALADGLAGLVDTSRSRQLGSRSKTVRGSTVFFLVTIAIFFLAVVLSAQPVTAMVVVKIIFGGLLLAGIEALLPGDFDNWIIPAIAGLVLYWIV